MTHARGRHLPVLSGRSPNGVLLADDAAVREIAETLQTAEGSSDDSALSVVRFMLGIALVHRDARQTVTGVWSCSSKSASWAARAVSLFAVPLIDVYAARERARCGARDGAIPVMRSALDDLLQAGRLAYGVVAPAFWWRRCWTVAPRATCRSPDGDRPLGDVPTDQVWCCAISGCCGCARCWPGHTATRRVSRLGTAIVRWRHRLASKDIWRGRRR